MLGFLYLMMFGMIVLVIITPIYVGRGAIRMWKEAPVSKDMGDDDENEDDGEDWEEAFNRIHRHR